MLGYLLIWGTIGILSTVADPRALFSNKTIQTGRCLSHCLETFLQHGRTNDEVCDTVPYCNMCWTVCRLHSTEMLQAVCDRGTLCKRGCKTACRFNHNLPPAADKETMILDTLDVQSDSIVTSISWKPPKSDPKRKDDQYFAYVILVRKRGTSSEWEELHRTASTSVEFETDTLPMPPEFQLLALTSKGVVASSTFSPNSLVVEWHQLEKGRLEEGNTATYIADSGVLNVSIEMDIIDRKLQVTLLWNHPNKGLLRCGKEDVKCHYNINWFIVDCAAYELAPPCWDLPYGESASKELYYSESPNFTIPGITYNTEAKVDIKIEDSHNNEIKGWLKFRTPLCFETNVRMTVCYDDESLFRENNRIDETASKAKKKDKTDEPTTEMNKTAYTMPPERLSWGDLVNLRINRKPVMTYDPSTNKMDVNLTWSTDINYSFDKYVVTWYNNEYAKPEENETKNTHIILKLDVDTEYVIQVSTEKWDGSQRYQVVDIMDLFTQKNLSSSPVVASPITLQHKNDLGTLSGVIAAVVVATILIIVGFVLLFYKMRKSFKDIIITKTFVTKSNSYKSNVGAGKSNYSNQLMVISDEWELDPKLLKFSTPLGQGAFGKVVTGYCNDQKVAIKLVKEGAPLSYKEDLVAEINLMKRIGSNPNIVSMIGACTLNEPIALVMEFVPHGNLQNFLKKCRMDGDLRKRSGGASEIAYAMVHDSGDIENCLITPADMLSFARQVAMAMEYLTDRRYVHRDLAARNVLLGYNKVVKLCDFGLSRDIYNDNQYKKLTNGKLPLKWMAIESLRDRVFTTQSDVWSFGVLLWEIVTMGASPYPHIALSDLYYVLVNGYRMEKTSNCSEELYAIMLHCWAALPQDRPCFTQLRMMLEELLEQDRNYLVLENINVPLNTSENSSSPSSLDDMSTQPSGASSGILVAPLTKEELRVNVCIHGKSTDRLLRKSESDSSP